MMERSSHTQVARGHGLSRDKRTAEQSFDQKLTEKNSASYKL